MKCPIGATKRRDLCHQGVCFASQSIEETYPENRTDKLQEHREKQSSPYAATDKFQIGRLVSKSRAVDQHQRQISTGGLIPSASHER
jgi:hypothetical protein